MSYPPDRSDADAARREFRLFLIDREAPVGHPGPAPDPRANGIEGRGGARRDRTDDLMLAKHALYQLSYGPLGMRAPQRRRLFDLVSSGVW